jgi:hypothetical protein
LEPDSNVARATFSERQILWTFGHPRSGTTWFARLVRDGFNAKLWNEPNFGPFLAFRHRIRQNEPKRLDDPTFWFSDPQSENWRASLNLFLMDTIARQVGDAGDADLLIIKEPNASTVAPLIAEIMPNARFVMMVRDVRDVAASLIDARKPGSWMANRLTEEFDREKIVRQTVNRVRRIAPQIRALRSSVAAGHYAEVRYEALRTDTTQALGGFADALNLATDPARVRAAVDEHAYERIPADKRGPGKFIRNAKIGGWRDELLPKEVAFIQNACGDFMSDHGYEPVDPAELRRSPS